MVSYCNKYYWANDPDDEETVEPVMDLDIPDTDEEDEEDVDDEDDDDEDDFKTKSNF
jgi:hypothetical protein